MTWIRRNPDVIALLFLGLLLGGGRAGSHPQWRIERARTRLISIEQRHVSRLERVADRIADRLEAACDRISKVR